MSWIVYQNMPALMEAREWTVTPDLQARDDFEKTMQRQGYVVLVGKNRHQEPSSIVITREDSSIPNHKNDFVRMAGQVSGEVLLISNRVLTTAVREYSNTAGLNIYSDVFDRFKIDMRRAPLVPKHEIVDKSEVAGILNYTKPNEIPGISINDTQAVWLGARLRDIIRIESDSDHCGKRITYRYCVP